MINLRYDEHEREERRLQSRVKILCGWSGVYTKIFSNKQWVEAYLPKELHSEADEMVWSGLNGVGPPTGETGTIIHEFVNTANEYENMAVVKLDNKLQKKYIVVSTESIERGIDG